MTAAKQSAIFNLLEHPCFSTGAWSCLTQKDPALGEYGRTEIYCWEGIPVFRLEISFNPPRTRAFVAENWKFIPALKRETQTD